MDNLQKNKEFFASLFTVKKAIILTVILFFAAVIFLFTTRKGSEIIDKKNLAIATFSALEKVAQFMPIERDTKKELEVVDKLVAEFNKQDNVIRTYLVLLQNSTELRPGGGFLGQYAIVKIKNGQVENLFIEDANLLDQRINADVQPPYPFQRMMQIKRWKFRDSNFSPDFPTNVEKAKYFYRLGGGRESFDGAVAVNSQVLNDVLKITGPITVPGFPGEYNSDNAIAKLESQVEKDFEAQGINVQDRKLILKKMAPIIVQRLMTLGNISKIASFAHEEMSNKNVMLYFENKDMQKFVEDVHWDGRVSQDWGGDYLMVVDANMGALKSDEYIKRDITYDVDLTQPKPIANVTVHYTHTATQGNWHVSDYHSYLRLYVPKGSTFLERQMVSMPVTNEDFNKTTMGFISHTLIGRDLNAHIKYELPESLKNDYRLLIQKQSGVGDVPIKIHIKTDTGEYNQEAILKKDLRFDLQK